MKLVIDMNLSPSWVSALGKAGYLAVHWSEVGHPRATDRQIMSWAKRTGCIVFTHDLDFGAILAATNADSPSVIQIRTQDPSPARCASVMIDILGRYAEELECGVLLTIDEEHARIRVLPIRWMGGQA